MPDPYGYLRSCAGCSAHLLTYAALARDEAVLCEKCEPGLETAEEQLEAKHPRFSLWQYPNTREFILLHRDGDRLFVRQLGNPDAEAIETNPGMIRPRFSYAKLNRVRAKQRYAKASRVRSKALRAQSKAGGKQ